MPRGRPSRITITLSPREQRTLQRYDRSPTLPAGLGRRARVILLRATGLPILTIAKEVGLSRTKAYKWLKRWQVDGVAGLNDKARGRQPQEGA